MYLNENEVNLLCSARNKALDLRAHVLGYQYLDKWNTSLVAARVAEITILLNILTLGAPEVLVEATQPPPMKQ